MKLSVAAIGIQILDITKKNSSTPPCVTIVLIVYVIMEEIVESENIPSNTGKMVWSMNCWTVLLRVVRDIPRRERPWNVKSDIPGSH